MTHEIWMENRANAEGVEGECKGDEFCECEDCLEFRAAQQVE